MGEFLMYVAFARLALTVSALAMLTNCAAIVSGKEQELSVETNPAGANCNLERNGEFIGSVSETPGKVKITKTKHDINLSCSRRNYETAETQLDSGLDPWVFGNILIGGLIGWAIDSGIGSDNLYPEKTSLQLKTVPGAARTSRTMPPRRFGQSVPTSRIPFGSPTSPSAAPTR
ncbi:MAG: hypothetical protein K2Q12_07870 [Rickettsiales bacterium]|nr:hypothetical protein [Rickettsiales bacterium]